MKVYNSIKEMVENCSKKELMRLWTAWGKLYPKLDYSEMDD